MFTKTGQGFYLHSPCEFQRFTLSARDVLEVKCKIDLPEGSRPPPPETETPKIEETAEKDAVEQEKSADVTSTEAPGEK